MKKLTMLLLVAGAVLAVIACTDMFAPKGCIRTIYVVDSMKTVSDSTWQVDTIARVKLCAQ